MVFQSYNLWPHMNVLDNLTLAPRKILGLSAAEAQTRAEQALAEVGMADHIRSRSTQLSGGERQRVAIARALMMRPRVLLCDDRVRPRPAGRSRSTRRPCQAQG
jgi:polar amino acid transport system ATP-binding protein